MYAQVIVDINHTNVDRVFEYRIPENMTAAKGSRVLVPFGGSNRTVEGYVLDVCPQAAFSGAVKSIARVIEPDNSLRPDQIELARWIARRYNCLLSDSLRLMLTAGQRGERVREKKERIVGLALEGEEYEKAQMSLLSKEGKCKAPMQRQVMELLKLGPLAVTELESHLPGAARAAAGLLEKGWLTQFDHQVLRKPYSRVQASGETHVATAAQKNAVDRINRAMAEGGGAFVLRGVTGSGKTEVYLQCIRRCMDMGSSAILLVPEISLTPQTVERFRGRFGDVVAVLHSRLSDGERYDEWRRIRGGKVQVAVGARSAVFAPFEKLGLIVIDEEHESSYKSDKTPRYDAIEVAQKRCADHGGVLVLGSATPGLETWCKVAAGEYEALELPDRINGRPLPKVTLVDMRQELAAGNRSMFSQALYESMRECYLAQKQMILFLNRRGYSSFVSCRGCGYVFECDSCSVSMTYHKYTDTLKCHYCGAQKALPGLCPACGKPYLKQFGAGTQQVEEQVLKLFPGIRALRMDHDTTQKKDAHLKILSEFSRGRADVLIGTQMIAKGLDFPQVTLVGVVAADLTLHQTDYRASERAFQLLTQVAGRAGRDKDEGKVIVQTYSPGHPAVRLAAEHDFKGFYSYEIEKRRQSLFPPFADFVRFVFAGQDAGALGRQGDEIKSQLEEKLNLVMVREGIPLENLMYVVSSPAPLNFLRGEYRHQVIIKLLRDERQPILLEVIRLYAREQRQRGLMNGLEVNPNNML